MNSSNENNEGNDLQARILYLAEKLELEMQTLKTSHDLELDQLRQTCAKGFESMQNNFNDKFDQIRQGQGSRLKELEQEILYLREMNSSQRIMMESKYQYIKELEQRLNEKKR